MSNSHEIRGLTVAVGDWYAATLAVCLYRNMRYMSECLVITTPGDHAVKAVASKVPGVSVFETDAFTRHGAAFNKGLAIEEAFDRMGREGWILIHDADILFPDAMPLDNLDPEKLHGATRRILENPNHWHPGLDWSVCPVSRDGGPIGFFQLFHADAPSLRDKRPWYEVSFAHAGGGDAYFVHHFPVPDRVILPVEVLHLGPKDTHWFGTDDASKDVMAAFIVRNGWARSHPRVDRTADARLGEIVERVEVPGYEPTGYELPFVRRRRQRHPRPRPERRPRVR